MKKFYDAALSLINSENAYVCTCDSETISKNREKGVECSCRKRDKQKNLSLWNKMLNSEFKKGEACLRLKIDMKAKNYVMRDPVIFRINYTVHYRQKNKYCVWPLYDFENSLEDSWNGITHILRSAEFGKMREELQNYIKDLFNLKKQTIIQYGRFNLINNITQGRKIRELIENKKLTGWDDLRLVTLKALKKRGILKETLYDLVKQVGLSKTPTNIDFSILAKLNRIHLDKRSKRLFAIENPILIKFENLNDFQSKQELTETEIPLHPNLDLGKRRLKITKKIYIEKKDYEKITNVLDSEQRENIKLYRLMDGFNFYYKDSKFYIHSISYEEFRKNKNKESIIQWLSEDQAIKIFYLKSNSDEIEFSQRELIKTELLTEPYIEHIEENEIIQFIRIGFFKLGNKALKQFIFVHR